jgi:hypothetical protein
MPEDELPVMELRRRAFHSRAKGSGGIVKPIGMETRFAA